VWSVWSKTVDIYLSATGCMFQCGQLPAVVLAHPASLPLDRVLNRLSEAAQANAASGGKSMLHRTKLRIVLGGSLCPPIPFTPPAGIKNWQELSLLARSNAAQPLGIPAAQTLCEWDDRQAGLHAALPLAWMQGLRAWVTREKAQITAINPVWAIATQSKLAQASTVRALYLQEKEGITLLANPYSHQALADAATASHPALLGVFLTNTAESTTLDAAQQWLSHYGIAAPEVLKLSFGALAQPALTDAPSAWNNYWGHA
jgi:hypothetical protein